MQGEHSSVTSYQRRALWVKLVGRRLPRQKWIDENEKGAVGRSQQYSPTWNGGDEIYGHLAASGCIQTTCGSQ